MSIRMVKVPELKIYGVGDFNKRYGKLSFDGEIASEIENYGKKYTELHKGSITLGEQACLWNAYLLSELGKLDLGDASGAIYSLFEDIGKGNVTDDACNYDGGIKLKKFKDSDRSVEWIIHPEGFEKKDGVWKALLGSGSDVKHIIIPAPGYVPRTCDGSYRPDTGTPFTTVGSREEAEKSWTDAGYSPWFANKAVSYSYSSQNGKGTATVIRWHFGSGNGFFGFFVCSDPDYRGPPSAYLSNLESDIGSLCVSRTAGQS